MSLPNAAEALVPPEKLTGYLLALGHPVGGPKARFFRAHGFDDTNTGLLTAGLRTIAAQGVALPRPGLFGTKYTVVGDLPTPRGTTVRVETVWIVERSDRRPRLVTAYPARTANRATV